MIVVSGDLTEPVGRSVSATAVARRAAASGASVQVVGVLPEGQVADRLLLDLAADGLGHAAVLREPTRELEAADLDLALRDLPEVRVVVVVEMPASIIATAADQTHPRTKPGADDTHHRPTRPLDGRHYWPMPGSSRYGGAGAGSYG